MLSITIKKKILFFLQQFFSYFGYKLDSFVPEPEPEPEFHVPVLPKSNVTHLNDKFLLLLTPPNSGSTAIARYVCQSTKIDGLRHDARYEGAHCEGFDIIHYRNVNQIYCNPTLYINPRMVVESLVIEINKLKQACPEMEYIFEKYPDNACRYKSLLKIIPNTKVVANNRNPYAQIASVLKRKYSYTQHNRLYDSVEECIHYWLIWSEYIREACEKDNVPLVTYEQFCDNPDTMISAFGLEESEFKKDFHVSDVKNYPPQAIENMNEKQIALLSDLQKETITEALSEHEELLAYFGYELMH